MEKPGDANFDSIAFMFYLSPTEDLLILTRGIKDE